MSLIDDKLDCYMNGWRNGVSSVPFGHQVAPAHWPEEMKRGFADGQQAIKDAEQLERERLEKCDNPYCELKKGHKGVHSMKIRL